MISFVVFSGKLYLRENHTLTNQLNNDIILCVSNHISSFSVYENHYSRKRTAKNYLRSELNIKKMYSAYIRYCEENSVAKVNQAKEWL